MQNIVNQINQYLKSKVQDNPLFTDIYNDLFPDDSYEGLISRHDPGQANVKTYIDGSSEGSLSVSYYARFSNAAKCRECLALVIDILDDAELTDEDTEIYLSAISTPQFISVDDKERSIYSCTVNAEFNRA